MSQDAMLAVWTVLTVILCAISYFAGAKKQLEACWRHRFVNWMTDQEWIDACDVSKKRWNHELKRP